MHDLRHDWETEEGLGERQSMERGVKERETEERGEEREWSTSADQTWSMEMRGWNHSGGVKWRGAVAVLAWLLALVPKTRPSVVHMNPTGTVNRAEGRVGGFSWATEGSWEGCSWLPECSLL